MFSIVLHCTAHVPAGTERCEEAVSQLRGSFDIVVNIQVGGWLRCCLPASCWVDGHWWASVQQMVSGNSLVRCCGTHAALPAPLSSCWHTCLSTAGPSCCRCLDARSRVACLGGPRSHPLAAAATCCRCLASAGRRASDRARVHRCRGAGAAGQPRGGVQVGSRWCVQRDSSAAVAQCRRTALRRSTG